MTREVTLDEVVAELAARWRFDDEPADEVVDPAAAAFLAWRKRRGTGG
jgi:hypothetical protein